MATAEVRQRIAEIRHEIARRKATAANPVLDELRADPALIFRAAGMAPDDWQQRLMNSTCSRILLLCCRQAGKSTTSAAVALKTALTEDGSLTLLLSPSLRQSSELFRKVVDLYRALGRPVPVTQESALQMTLANGARVVSLPGSEGTIRGYSSVRLLIVDEASRVPDELMAAVRPMLVVSKGRLLCLSTPFGQRGWFHHEWEQGRGWERTRITALMCPRISPEFLEEEERALGPRWFAQEFMCSFEEAADAVFSAADVKAALSQTIEPLFFEGEE